MVGENGMTPGFARVVRDRDAVTPKTLAGANRVAVGPEQRRRWRAVQALLCAAAFSACLFNGVCTRAQSVEAKPLYLDPSQPIEVRVDDLMKRMTLKEKVGQLNLPCAYVDELGKTASEKAEAAKKFAGGTYTNDIGPGSGFFTLLDTLGQKDLHGR